MSSTTDRSLERGQILVLLAGGMVALLIIAALAFDVGMMLLERRDEQNAADAAALAGGRFVLDDAAAAEAAARSLARDNGFDDADPDEVVNVYIPPIHGTYARLPGFIEVEIQGTRPSIFGGIIGRAVWPVGAYAVATNQQSLSFPFSMLALDPTACKAIAVSGTGVVDAVGSIQSNSSGEDCVGDPVSFARTGGSEIDIGDNYCRAFGPIQDQGSGTMTCRPDPNSFALPDPLAGLPGPDKPPLGDTLPMQYMGTVVPAPAIPRNCPGAVLAPSETSPVTCKLAPTGAYSGQPWLLHPGLYPGGLEITADTTAYLMPGIYWIGGGGIRVATGGSIITVADAAHAAPGFVGTIDDRFGGGVLIYNSQLPAEAAGPIVLDGSAANMKLKPYELPAFPEYNKIVIYQDRAIPPDQPSITLNGSASVTVVEGLIYAPNAQVKLNGNGGFLTVGQIIAGTYDILGGGGHIDITDDDLFEAIIVAAGLVE